MLKVRFAKGALLRSATLLFTFAAAVNVAFARTLQVPGDAATIQEAVNLSANGDTVLVRPGVYSEFVIFGGRAITLKADGPASDVIIAPPSDKAAITCMSGESFGTVVDGFTIRNCAMGANIINASPTLQNNIFTNCAIGIFSQGAGAFLRNEIVGSSSAIVVHGNAVIDRQSIHHNDAAVRVEAGDPIVSNSFIFSNLQAGILSGSNCSPTIQQNVIYQNGVGISFRPFNSVRGPALVHNTILAASGAPAVSAGLSPGRSFLINNIIVGEPAIAVDGPERPRMTFNLFHSPIGPAVHGFTIAEEDRSIVADPKFHAPTLANFELQLDSPAIDAGTLTNTFDYDVLGAPRPIDGNGDRLGRPDLGAYEFDPGLLRTPANFTATAFMDRVELNWLALGAGTDVLIFRSTSTLTNFVEISRTTATNAVDTNVAAGVTYYYYVVARSGDILSKPSPTLPAYPGNRPPIAVADTISVPEDTNASFDPTNNDSDPDGDSLHIVRLVNAPANFQITGPAGISYSFTENFVGELPVQYVVSDDRGHTATNVFRLSVQPVNDPPVLSAQNPKVVVPEVVSQIPFEIADPDSDTFQLRITQQPSSGYLYISNNALFYRPVRGFAGDDMFYAVVSDGQLDSGGTEFHITVQPCVDADADGMADAWENLWDVNNPNADLDGDGRSNLQEYRSATSPNDTASVLRISRMEQTPEGYTKITWPAVGGVRYRVSSADILTGNSSDFTPLVQSLALEMELAPPGQVVERSFLDVRLLTGRSRFYQIHVIWPGTQLAPDPGGGIVINPPVVFPPEPPASPPEVEVLALD